MQEDLADERQSWETGKWKSSDGWEERTGGSVSHDEAEEQKVSCPAERQWTETQRCRKWKTKCRRRWKTKWEGSRPSQQGQPERRRRRGLRTTGRRRGFWAGCTRNKVTATELRRGLLLAAPFSWVDSSSLFLPPSHAHSPSTPNSSSIPHLLPL